MILRALLISLLAFIGSFSGYAQNQNAFISDSLSATNHPVLKDTNTVFTVEKVVAWGNKRTKSYIVQREIAILVGQTYTPESLNSAIKLTREQLMNTALFVDVLVDTFMQPGGKVEVSIHLKERWYLFPMPYFRVIDRNWNVWIKEHGASLDRANIGVKIMHQNFSGRNDKFNMWIIGGYTKQFAFNYYRPYFDKKLRFGYNLGFQYARNRELNHLTKNNKQQFYSSTSFVQEHLRADAGLSYRLGSKMRMFLKGAYHRESISDSVALLNPNYLGGGKTKAGYFDVTYNLQYFNVDYIPYPVRGWYVDANAIYRNGGSGSLNMVALGGKFFATKNIMPNTWVDLHVAGILRLPQNQPYFNSKLLGYGDVYMQGLEYYVVDGTMGGFVRGVVKKQVLQFAINNLFKMKKPESTNLIRKTFNGLSKTHNHIPFRVFAKVFGNVGYVHGSNVGSSIMNNRLLRTGGVGLDIVTVYDWVLKLELSFNQFDRGGINNIGNKLFVHTQADF
jgi:hypothetical protein